MLLLSVFFFWKPTRWMYVVGPVMFVIDWGLWTDTRLANWIRKPFSSLLLSVVLVHLPISSLPSSFITTFLLSDFFSYLFISLVLIYHYLFILLSVLCLICPSVFVYFFLPFTVLFSTRQYGPPFCKVSSSTLYSDKRLERWLFLNQQLLRKNFCGIPD
jgi:hypothetical protein